MILVDSSVWIDYFRSGEKSEKLDLIIDENLVAINDLILAELIPFLRVRNERKIIRLLNAICKLPLSIQWGRVIEWQYECLKNGFNGIGIPDLIIAQNAEQNQCQIYSLDNHFKLMKNIFRIELI